MTQRVFICADHGMAIVYFLQSDIIATLLKAGIEVIVLTDDEIKNEIEKRFRRPGLLFEGLRLSQANQYARKVKPRWQWLLAYLRRVGGSRRINTEAMDSHIWEVWVENSWKFRLGMWMPARLWILLLRNFASVRKALVQMQTSRFTPTPGLYIDLFQKYHPDLVIASTPGWRLDRYVLREAKRFGITTMTVIVGWDNPSSYAISGAPVDFAVCWSEVQKQELVMGSDWDPEHVFVGGMPSYDGYFQREWLMSRETYFKLHGLSPDRKLISYASSFVHFAPNYPNIAALAQLISSDKLEGPSQLLVRLHPSHFQDKPQIFAEERERIQELELKYPNVKVVKPVPLGGSLGYYSGEDMDEKSSMMEYSDVFVTVYSTMVVECAVHDKPIVAAVIDIPGGWNRRKKYSLSLKDIGNWPTHKRFRESKAGRVAATKDDLADAINLYLKDPSIDSLERKRFIEHEVTYTDATAGKRTAHLIMNVLNRKKSERNESG